MPRARRAQRRRRNVARGTAGALVIALVGASVWRLDHRRGRRAGRDRAG